MNETLQVLETRRSCRKFKPDMITNEELEAVLRAGTFAPTGMGKQSPVILAITNKEVRDTLAKENARPMGRDMDPFYGAPVVLVVLAKKAPNGMPDTHINDGSLVMGNMLNAAHSLGLGSIWVHRADLELNNEFGRKLLSDLGLNLDEYDGIGNCCLGYKAQEDNAPAPRKENYVYYIK